MTRGIRVATVNSELVLVYDGDVFIGSVRQGLDHFWYPELPASHSQKDAIADLITACDAVRKYTNHEAHC